MIFLQYKIHVLRISGIIFKILQVMQSLTLKILNSLALVKWSVGQCITFLSLVKMTWEYQGLSNC